MADRSEEFFALAHSIPATGAMSSIRGGGASAGGTLSSQRPGDASALSRPAPASQANNPALAELRTFRHAAFEISRDITTTSSLLAELSRLVKTEARMFVDESSRANALVLTIKANIEGLHSRLEEASHTLDRSRRRLGKTSQAGMEASNLVGQLKEEFGRTASGFKAVLEERSDGMKDTNDRKRRVIGGGEGGGVDGNAAGGGGEEERVDLMTLMNKPAVYGGDQRTPSFGDTMGGMAGGMGGGGNGGMPSLDLRSGIMAMAQRHQDESGGIPAGESSSQLPRPHGIGGGYDSQGLRLRHANSSGAPFDASSLPAYSGATSSYYPGEALGHPAQTPLTPAEIQRMESASGQQRQFQLIPDQEYLRQRADAMTQVESNIVELGTIFNKLAVMVNEHRDMVQRVEDNVDDANSTLNLSMATLTDTLQNLQTNRALAAKVLGIVVLFIIMFIIFFA